jgi:hypothetical protein
MKDPASEIGRELKVSELKPRTIVWLGKEGRDTMATMWVVEVGPVYVHFRAGAVRTEFYAERRGPDLDQITDNDHIPMRMFEYLGEP